MKYRLTWQLAISIVLVLVIALIPVVIYFLDFKDIFFYIMGAIIGWTVLVLIALMGAFLLGLAVGHRISSKSEFTPFEVEMMKMKEEVSHVKEIFHRHNLHHTTVKTSEKAPAKNGSKDGTTMVEEEPDLQKPTETGPGMKPVGKVRCNSCKRLIPFYSNERPLNIKCTNCGKKGVLR